MKLLHKFNLTKSLKQIFGIFNLCKLSESNNKQNYIDRWHLSAEGFLLLPSALRPHLSRFILILLLLLSFSLAAETFWLTDEVSAASIELTVPASYTIELNPGTGTTFGESKNQPISVKTSGSFGYTLNIKGSSDTNLKNGSNVIKTITKSEGYDDSGSYKSSGEANTWAYKPGKLNSVANTKYLPFPSVETLLEKTDKNNDTANNYDFTIAAKVDNTLPSGTYSNNFVISATANTVSYSITYNLNSGTWSGTSPQTGTTINNIVKLDSNKPTRENYEFLGWCSTTPTNNNTENPTCSGQTYTAGDEYTLTNGDNTKTLNAIWKWIKPTMQNFKCSSLSRGQSTTLTDIRDNNTYTVAKLNDDKCWMTQNLKLKNMTIDHTNSDMSSGSFPLPDSLTSGSWNNNASAQIYYYSSTGQYYYSWFAATAGGGTESNASNTNYVAPNSICPKNWRLPLKADYDTLITKYNGTTIQQSPANFVSGYGSFGNGSWAEDYGSWYSTASVCHSGRPCLLITFSSGSTPSSSSDGPSNTWTWLVRCIARN